MRALLGNQGEALGAAIERLIAAAHAVDDGELHATLASIDTLLPAPETDPRDLPQA